MTNMMYEQKSWWLMDRVIGKELFSSDIVMATKIHSNSIKTFIDFKMAGS